MRVEESIVIERPADDVFEFFSERSNDVVWMGVVEESEWLQPAGAEGLGRRGRTVIKAGGRRSEYIDEVTAWEPGRLVAHRTVEGPMELNTACVAEPAGEGSCRATVMAAVEPRGILARLTDPVVARAMGRTFRADLARLKRLLEGEAMRPPSEEAAGAPPTANE
jgi:uncharacterized membrane protein